MISFNRLGNLGRLGNQMFQYASLKGIAENHNYKFAIPPKEAFGTVDEKVLNDIESTIYDIFELGEFEQGLSSFPTYLEKEHTFDKNLFDSCPDNIDLMGYFQTEKYFKHIENQIRSDFTFKDEILDLCEKFLFDPDCISLHIRRGDYVNLQHFHPLIDIDYYEKALTYFSDRIPVIIFSDDPSWCKEQKLFSDDRFLVSENNQTGIDLCLMSMCKYHIIANSSLSWWGSWLAKSKKTIAPKIWFTEQTGNDCTDKYLKNWIII